ncbi:MAG: DUF3592 domain-containing protein [Bulleidia sp.]
MKKWFVKFLNFIFFLSLVAVSAAAVFLSVKKIFPYYTYPKTEARVVSVENYQLRSDISDTFEYESRICLSYTVDGQPIQGWLTLNGDSTIQENEAVSIAYNPDNPSDCYAVRPFTDLFKMIAIIAGPAFVLFICWKANRLSKPKQS